LKVESISSAINGDMVRHAFAVDDRGSSLASQASKPTPDFATSVLVANASI